MAKYSVKIESYTDIDLVSNTLANTLNVEPQTIHSKIRNVPCMFGSTESYENAKIIADAIIESGGKAIVIPMKLNNSNNRSEIHDNSSNKDSEKISQAHIKHCLSCGSLIGIESHTCSRCGCKEFESYEDYIKNRPIQSFSNEANHQGSLNRKYYKEGYKCPNCGKKAGKPIGFFSKTFSIGLKGLASNKIGKSYECENCRYTW